jgi:hypothetical protein
MFIRDSEKTHSPDFLNLTGNNVSKSFFGMGECVFSESLISKNVRIVWFR